MSFITLVSSGFKPGMQVVTISEVEPTRDDLINHWNNLALKRVDTNFGCVSDLIEVYEDKQMSKAFLNIYSSICTGMNLIPNPSTTEDAVMHYYQ
jgi:hypothetical protein